jgi:hypothetical protein
MLTPRASPRHLCCKQSDASRGTNRAMCTHVCSASRQVASRAETSHARRIPPPTGKIDRPMCPPAPALPPLRPAPGPAVSLAPSTRQARSTVRRLTSCVLTRDGASLLPCAAPIQVAPYYGCAQQALTPVDFFNKRRYLCVATRL